MDERAWKVASFVGVGLGAIGVIAVVVIAATRGGDKVVPVAEVAAQPIAIDATVVATVPIDAAAPYKIDWGKLDAGAPRTAAQIAEDTRRVNAESLVRDQAEKADETRKAMTMSDADLRVAYLAKLSAGQRFTLAVGGDGTAVTVTAQVCNDAVLGIFETDLGSKLKKFGFTWLVCADQGSRRRL